MQSLGEKPTNLITPNSPPLPQRKNLRLICLLHTSRDEFQEIYAFQPFRVTKNLFSFNYTQSLHWRKTVQMSNVRQKVVNPWTFEEPPDSSH